jgi:hypothetical protein
MDNLYDTLPFDEYEIIIKNCVVHYYDLNIKIGKDYICDKIFRTKQLKDTKALTEIHDIVYNTLKTNNTKSVILNIYANLFVDLPECVEELYTNSVHNINIKNIKKLHIDVLTDNYHNIINYNNLEYLSIKNQIDYTMPFITNFFNLLFNTYDIITIKNTNVLELALFVTEKTQYNIIFLDDSLYCHKHALDVLVKSCVKNI